MSTPTTNTAFTAPINPSGSTPILTCPQIWAMLQLKIKSAETFVPGGISSTTVLSETIDPTSGNPVTVREVIFVADQRKATETVTTFGESRAEFVQEDGSKVQNIVSEGEDGELYMTYVFDWKHPGANEEELKAHGERMKGMSTMAVNGTISVMRELVKSGKF